MTPASGEDYRILELEAENAILRQRVAELSDNKRLFEEYTTRDTRRKDTITAWHWEQDKDFRFVEPVAAGSIVVKGYAYSEGVGLQRWELRGTNPLDSGWILHRQALLNHEPFCDFEYTQNTDDVLRWISVSGRPLFDTHGNFSGYSGIAQDLTERKLAQRRQCDALRLLRQIVDSIPMAVALKSIDEGYRFVMWNKSAHALYGISAEEAVGSTSEELWPGEEGKRITDTDRHLVEDGGMQESIGGRIVTRGGSVVFTHLRKALIHDQEGKPSHVLGVMDDITDKMAAEQRLRDSEERFRRLTALSADWYWEQDAEFRFTSNDSGTAARSLSPALLKGRTRWEIDGLIIKDPQVWVRHRQVLEAHETFRDFEYQRYKDDGQIATISISGEPKFNAKCEFLGYRGLGTDVTARKQMEATLSASEKRFIAVASALLEGVVLFDETGVIVDCNGSAERILGLSRLELLGTKALFPIGDVSRPDGTVLPVNEFPPAPFAVEPQSLMIGLKRADGQRWLATNVTVLSTGDAGKPTGWVTTFGDVTALEVSKQKIRQMNVELESRVLERTAELESANRELEAFSYSIAHDIRSPLSSIDGFSALLQKAVVEKGLLSQANLHQLSRIRYGVKQMGQLTDGLLSLAKLSRSPVSRQRVELSNIAVSIVHNLQEQDLARVASVNVQPGLVAQADLALIRQVLDNLLSNAWKFTSKKACTEIFFGMANEYPGNWVYQVRDNGAGFDMAYSDKLFGTFQRLHSPDEFPGSGIGLATVQRIISRHGGAVWAEAEVGKGSTFYFTLAATDV